VDENFARSLYEKEIDKLVAQLLPNGSGAVSAARLRFALETVAQAAFTAGGDYALMSLMTANDVADKLGISVRRVRAIAANRHARFGVGYKVPGTSQWLFRPTEIEALRPGPNGRPRKTNRDYYNRD